MTTNDPTRLPNDSNSPHDDLRDDMRRAEATIINELQPLLNTPPLPDIETFLKRQRAVYESLERLLDALIECVEGNTQFWGNDDEDYMNVRLSHINAYALHVINGDTKGMLEGLVDESFVHTGHTDACPLRDDTGEGDLASLFYDDGDHLAEAIEMLKTCTCGENLYDRDSTVEHMTAALRIVTTTPIPPPIEI